VDALRQRYRQPPGDPEQNVLEVPAIGAGEEVDDVG